MQPYRKLTSHMGWSDPSHVFVRGMDLPNEILGKLNLGDMAWLEMTGRTPTPQQSVVFNALLVVLVEHGVTPQALASRMVYLCAPESLQAAVAAGLCGIGSRFGGSSEAAARLLHEAVQRNPGVDARSIAKRVVAEHRSRGDIVPGIGHPLHKPIDPRVPRLFEIASENGLSGQYVELMTTIGEEASREYGKPLPVNAPGAIAAISCELGLPWRAARGIAVIGRAIGLVGHLIEEMNSGPMAMELWTRTEAEASVDPRAMRTASE